MRKVNPNNVMVETAISHAVSAVRQTLQHEIPCMEVQEINRAILVGLACVVAQELTACNGGEKTDPVISCMPWNAGTHFLVALQEELHRLYAVRSRMQ